MGRLTPRERTGLLVGVLAMFLALDVAFLVSLVGLPFTPFALGQAIIDVLPGWISIPLIELLHFWAKALLVIGVLALFLIAGGIAGMFAVYQLVLWPLAVFELDVPFRRVAADAGRALVERSVQTVVLAVALLAVNLAGVAAAVVPFLTLTIAYSFLAAAYFALPPTPEGDDAWPR